MRTASTRRHRSVTAGPWRAPPPTGYKHRDTSRRLERLKGQMNNTIAVEQNADTLGGPGIPRTALTAAFVLLGLILLYFANRYVRRHHKTRHHHRY